MKNNMKGAKMVARSFRYRAARKTSSPKSGITNTESNVYKYR
jgi:hypothetical protein